MKKILTITVVLALCLGLYAQDGVQPLRRPLSNTQPAWIVHIDCWNYPDPEKIIELIPQDIRPFVIFNISLSSNDNVTHNGPLIIDSWIRTCAAKQVWCMVQPSSGAHNRLPEITRDGQGKEAYEQYFRDYANFLGFSFAEQFWDFGTDGCPTWEQRQDTYIALLELAHRYGGYLTMSFTQAYDNCLMMPIGMLKNNDALRLAFEQYGAHFICCEKTTMKKGFYDIESNCLGMWLSGYAGHYGIRFDTSGWMSNTDDLNDSSDNPYVEAAAIAPIIEHMLLTGQTVLDGPELTWQQVTRSAYTVNRNGFQIKQHDLFPHCVNIYADIIRKIIHGDWRILSRSEVIARTRICILNDISSGNKAPYVTPQTLFNGLYRFNIDQGGVSYGAGWQDQRWWTKKSGRYPAIPQVFALLDNEAQALTPIPASQLATRWPNTNAKIQELSLLFPPVSSGEVFVARASDTYVTYNPYQYNDAVVDDKRTFSNAVKTVTGNIDSITIPDGGTLRIYLNNYRNDYASAPYAEKEQQTNQIVLRGLTALPQYTFSDRANHTASTMQANFDNGNLTLSVTHNGPLDITISDIHAVQPTVGLAFQPYTVAVVTTRTPDPLDAPAAPEPYTGILQYEAENMDYQGTTVTVNNKPGSNTISDHYGQGYLSLIPRTDALLRDTVDIPQSGTYTLSLRYMSPASASAVPLALSIDGQTLSLPATIQSNQWQELHTSLHLTQGPHVLQLGFTTYWGSSLVYLDALQLHADATDALTDIVSEQRPMPRKRLVNGILIIDHNGQSYSVLGSKL